MIEAVIGIIVNPSRNKILLLKRRSDKIMPGTWAPVGGAPYPKTEDFKQKTQEEIEAETGLIAKFVLEAPIMQAEISGQMYNMHPFLYEASEYIKIKLNNEHSESRWVTLSDLSYPEYDQRLQALAKIIAMEKNI